MMSGQYKEIVVLPMHGLSTVGVLQVLPAARFWVLQPVTERRSQAWAQATGFAGKV